MKTILKDVPIYKQVPDGVKQVPLYVCDDGKEFTNELDAKNHEDKITKRNDFVKKYFLRNIELKDGERRNFQAIFIKEKNETTKIDLNRFIGKGFPFNDLRLGWNLIDLDDSGDCWNTYCYDLKSFISQLEQEIENKKLDIVFLKSME